MRKVTDILEQTALFSEISASPDGADIVIEIQPVARRPYWSTPAHNPAFLLLSLAIPFWWSDMFGYRFSAEDQFGHEVEVDTTREGYRIMWSLAPLFNLSPSRGLLPSRAREADQVKLQLLPLLSDHGHREGAPNKPLQPARAAEPNGQPEPARFGPHG